MERRMERRMSRHTKRIRERITTIPDMEQEAFDHSYLDFPNDSLIQWPHFDHWKPVFVRRSH